MIRSASLLYALVVSLLLSGALGSVILAGQLRSARTERWLARSAARDNAYSGLFRCAYGDRDEQHGAERMDLFGEGIDSVEIQREQWGLFTHCRCSARRSDQQKIVAGLIAHQWPAQAPSLYVADHGEPIALAGNTHLEGPCALPAAGLRRAYIEGRPFQGSLEVEGGTEPSERSIPALPSDVLRALEMLIDLKRDGDLSGSIAWNDLSEDTVRSGAGVLHIDASSTYSLSDRALEGRVLVTSSDTLRLSATFHAMGSVIVAPYIIIQERSHGRLQCFSSQGIEVGKDVELEYPSVLACLNDGKGTGVTIRVSDGSTVEGTLIGKAALDHQDAQVLIELGLSTHVTGELWCDGPVQVSGSFEGTLIADRLVLRTASSVYRDHLLDAMIGPMHDAHFACIGIWDKDAASTVLAWDTPGAIP